MSARGLELFMLPEELQATLRHLVATCGAQVYRQASRRGDVGIDCTDELDQIQPRDRLFIAPRRLTSVERAGLPSTASYIGGAHCDVPSAEQHTLTLTVFGSRSDAYDPVGYRVLEDLHHHEVMNDIRAYLRPYLARPVIVSQASTSRPYRNLAYTEGAVQWLRAGGTWSNERQRPLRYTMPEGGRIPRPVPGLEPLVLGPQPTEA